MKNCSKVFCIFCAFHAEVQNHFHKSINYFHNDNAKEFFFAQFPSYLMQQGILHQSSCPTIPQQNGIAERKNCHLMELAHAPLFQMKVRKPF